MTKRKDLVRITTDACMIALFVVLSRYVTIPIGNVKITVAALPIILVAFVYGMKDTIIVSVLAEFLSQVLGYGLMPTTPLWMIPGVVRGVLLCLFISARRKKVGSVKNFKIPTYAVMIFVTCIIVLLLNTGVIALDAIIYHYYSKAYVFGDLFFRFIAMCASAVIYTVVTKAVVDAMPRELMDNGR